MQTTDIRRKYLILAYRVFLVSLALFLARYFVVAQVLLLCFAGFAIFGFIIELFRPHLKGNVLEGGSDARFLIFSYLTRRIWNALSPSKPAPEEPTALDGVIPACENEFKNISTSSTSTAGHPDTVRRKEGHSP